jgi:acetyltransferase-like isoleucine patch superfamily enzyme
MLRPARGQKTAITGPSVIDRARGLRICAVARRRPAGHIGDQKRGGRIIKRTKNGPDRLLRGLGNRFRLRISGPRLSGPASRVQVSPTAGLADVLINTIGGNVDIGDYVFFGHGVMLLTGTHDFTVTDQQRQVNRPTMDRDIIIERGAWIASRAVIIGPCRIGANAVIGCGCVIDLTFPQIR